jgi:hypothetical protein
MLTKLWKDYAIENPVRPSLPRRLAETVKYSSRAQLHKRIIIQDMWQNHSAILVDNDPPLESGNWTDIENTCLYFTYQHS